MNCCNQKNTIKHGRFKRKSDSQWVQRYRCKSCGKLYSQATADAAKYQKKRHLNHAVFQCLAANISMRQTALILNIHPITVARKLKYLTQQYASKLDHKKGRSKPTRSQTAIKRSL